MRQKLKGARINKRAPADLRDRILTLKARGARRQIALVVVAHPDDEALGAGATLATLVEIGDLVILVALTSGAPRRGEEMLRAAAVLGIPSDQVFLCSFP